VNVINQLHKSRLLGATFHTLDYCLQKELSDCETVLDLGCGPGIIYKDTNVDLTGVDWSEEALKQAKIQLKRHAEFSSASHRFRIKSGMTRKVQDDNELFYLIDAIAVTLGPGQALALEVGIRKAKEIAQTFKKPLITVSHMEGHLLSSFAKNAAGSGSKFGKMLLVL